MIYWSDREPYSVSSVKYKNKEDLKSRVQRDHAIRKLNWNRNSIIYLLG